jgi:hypothetical protein
MTGDSEKKALAMSDNLIAIMNDGKNSLEICRLEIDPPGPHLKSVCHFELPPLTSDSFVFSRGDSKEWVPTSKDYARYRPSRGYHSPFYSSTIRTLGLHLEYNLPHPGGYRFTLSCTMVISITALTSAIPADVRIVPWVNWGPSCTHIFKGSRLISAGPFWVTDTSPLVVRQFDVLSTWSTQSTTADTSSSQTGPPIFSSTEVSCDCWKAGKVTTNLPYRDVSIAYRKEFHNYGWMMADRDWYHWTSVLVCVFCGYSNYSGGSLIIRGDRETVHPPCIMWCRSCTSLSINCNKRRPMHGSLANIVQC